ncbi:c-type cytochrome biogenesis protein CcmI [Salinisphaera sp. SPP-AMP-43]|uniref:c-type cytochrome biogenesis protein CcmI n=1 Tax=Salinisphaera sp. SPP-AMP-43 TaxID=3121288 RepID=UPI003C6E9B59
MTIEFAVASTLLVGLCIVCLIWPLWRHSTGADERRRHANIEIYRQRYGEIERAVGLGRLSQDQAKREKDRIGRQLLSELDTDSKEKNAAAGQGGFRGAWRALGMAGGLIVTVAAGGYAWQGDGHALQQVDMPSVERQLQRLQDQVRSHPKAQDLRLRLAMAEKQHGEYAAAAHNLRRINDQRAAAIPSLLVGEAEMRLAAGSGLNREVRSVFARALAADPGNTKALWYLGLAASEAGDARQALGYWERLLKQPLSDSVRAKVRSRRDLLIDNMPVSAASDYKTK